MFIRSNSIQKSYIKNQTPFYTNSHYRIRIKFCLKPYPIRGKRKTLKTFELERLNVFDPNKYNKV